MTTQDYTKRILAAVATVLVVAIAVLPGCRAATQQTPYLGSLFASDAGQSHGGFEYTATWTATLVVTGGSGTLKLALQTGLGDAITKHECSVTDFAATASQLSMKLDGQPLVLPLEAQDTVWNGQFNDYYIASWGGDAPPTEIRGTISPTDFPGLGSLYYVELRLRPAPPEVRGTT